MPLKQKFFGDFADLKSVQDNFFPNTKPDTFPTLKQLVFAAYGGEACEGVAMVVFKKGRKLYEVNGSHCSCFGLEGQWTPEETSKAALQIRNPYDALIKEALVYHFPSKEQKKDA